MVSMMLALVSFAAQGPYPQGNSLRAEVRSEVPSKPIPEVTPEIRGDIYIARKMYREAVDAYRLGGADNPVLVNKTGIAYHQLLELDTAKKYYEKALKINPKYSEALNNLGTVYYARKSYRRAISQYKRALTHSPRSASIHSNLGTAYFARKNYAEAMKEYETALALDPEVFEHHSTAGVLLQERTVEERAKFHYYQAKLYAKSGMNERALLCLRKAIEEGFKDRTKIPDEPDFAAIRELPEFREIVAYQPRVL
jgi:tetratricopeptide (TPR) repeat protein